MPDLLWDNNRVDEWLMLNAPGFRRLSDANGVDNEFSIECPENHVTYRTIYNLIKGKHLCTKCYQQQRLWTDEKLDSWLAENRLGHKRLSHVENSRKPIEFLCDKNHIYKTSITNLLVTKDCKVCSRAAKRVTNDVVDEYIGKHALGYRRISDVSKSSEKIVLVCDQGHTWTPIVNNFIRHHYRCKLCNREKNVWTLEKLEKYLQENREGYTLVSGPKYINPERSDRYIEVRCKLGHQFQVRVDSFMRGTGCLECRHEAKRLGIDSVREIFRQNGCELLTKRYQNCKQLLDFVCSCSRKGQMSLDNFRKYKHCGRCGRDIRFNRKFVFLRRRDQIHGYREWKRKVKERDLSTCQKCNSVNGVMVAHHIQGFKNSPRLRTDINNGVTLCTSCHTDFHRNYGYGNNTRAQYDEWIADNRSDSHTTA